MICMLRIFFISTIAVSFYETRIKRGNNAKPNANQLTKKKKSSHVNGIINTDTNVNSSSSAPYDKIKSKIYMSNVCVVKELFECKEVNNELRHFICHLYLYFASSFNKFFSAILWWCNYCFHLDSRYYT